MSSASEGLVPLTKNFAPGPQWAPPHTLIACKCLSIAGSYLDT